MFFLCSRKSMEGPGMLRMFVEEAAALASISLFVGMIAVLASISLFVGMIAVWAQLIPQF